MLNEGFWDCLLQFVRRFRPCCIVVTPPCSTYSRARHYYKPSPGPRPIRSRQHPLGFPWLKAKDKRKADEGTLLAEKAWELIQIASEVGSRFLAEFPEDLGRTSAGVPASLWQMQQFQDVLALDGVKTFAVKLGPLPESCPHPGTHEALIGMTESGTWKTGPAAHLPWSTLPFSGPGHGEDLVGTPPLRGSGSVNGTVDSNGVFGTDTTEEHVDSGSAPIGVRIQSGCKGPPLWASHAGRQEEFCDGLGLCSPGRWHPKMRALDKSEEQ